MKRQTAAVLCPLFLFFALINVAGATDESFADQFLGSPLLVLTTMIIIDVLALIYHKLRK